MLWFDLRGWSLYGTSCPVDHALNFTSFGVEVVKLINNNSNFNQKRSVLEELKQ